MKKILLFVLVMSSIRYAAGQELQVGDKAPSIEFEDCILPQSGKLAKKVSLSQFAGKIVILDFWATWCGPCIYAMKKYEGFQKKFKGKIQVIGITHESLPRIQAFSKNRPVGFMLAVDTGQHWKKFFDYRTIPHVVLIDQHGVVKAITRSDEITETVIDDLWKNKTVSLPLKKDNLSFDTEVDYFNAAADTKESFNIQPGVKDFGGSMSKVGQQHFENRRISMLNFTIDGMYRMAYGASYFRTKLEVPEKEFDFKNPSNRYCLDVIVPEPGAGLYLYMQKKLPEHFDLKARMEKRKMIVTVLKRSDQPLGIKPTDSISKYYSSSMNFFSGHGVQVSALAEFLETHGIAGTPVVDETGVTGSYDIHMEWQPEKKGDLKEAFRKAGFVLVKEEREIEVLVLYR